MAALELKEIIWEITNVCNKNCKYCGSKNVTVSRDVAVNNGYSCDTFAERIANEIVKYPPKEITISGGEPATLLDDTLAAVITTFRKNAPKMVVKILTNGLFFHKLKNEKIAKILKHISVIGLSVNTHEDCRVLDDYICMIQNSECQIPITILTNFGTHNIFKFDEIKSFVETFKESISPIPVAWQVQLTQGNDLQLDKDGIKYLKEHLAQSNVFYVEADNLQTNGKCFAGIYSCGITYDGNVVPCLSMRSWLSFDNFTKEYQGNILDKDTNLKKIWRERFWNNRFENCKCCRDCIEYPEFTENKIINIQPVYATTIPIKDNPKESPYDKGGVFVYAAINPNDYTGDGVRLYGVINPISSNDGTGNPPNDSGTRVLVYAVFNPQYTPPNYTITTTNIDDFIKNGGFDHSKK